MASISYEVIFSQFLGNISDYDFASLDENDANEKMTEYLHKAMADTSIRKIFASSSLDDNIETLTYEMSIIIGDEEDREFVMDVLAKGMVVAWLRPYVQNRLNIIQFFGGKESNYYSQAPHTQQLRGLLQDAQKNVRKTIRDRGYSYPTSVEG